MKQRTMIGLALFALPAWSDAQGYNVVEISDRLGPVHQSWAFDINDRGDVVGQYVTADTVRTLGFTWRRGDAGHQLPQPYDPGVQPALLEEVNHHAGPVAINESGMVIGNAVTLSSSAVTSGYYSFLGGPAELPQLFALHPPVPLEAMHVSDLTDTSPALVVGAREMFDFDTLQSSFFGVVLEVDPEDGPTGTVVELATFGGRNSYVEAVNDAGLVVGAAELTNGRLRAFSSADLVTLSDLGTLGGVTSGALDVSAAGVVVGWAETADGHEHAFRYEDGAMVDLGTLGGATSRALAVDSSGSLVVGTARRADGEPRAALWLDGAVIDLNERIPESSGWRLVEATAVNAQGEIVGWGRAPDGSYQAFLLERAGSVLHAPAPGRAGETNTLLATEATSGGFVAFLAGTDVPGYLYVPACDAGLLLDRPQLLGLARADASGGASLSLAVPAALAGHAFRMQAIDLAACGMSRTVSGVLE